MRILTTCCFALVSATTHLVFAEETLAPAAQVNADAKQTADEPEKTCVKTGSRILRHGRDCAPEPGRSYDSEQLRNTGATDAGRALELLDPSISVRR